MKKHLYFAFSIVVSLFSCKFSTEQKSNTKVDHNTLLVAHNGSVFSVDLDGNKISWQHDSPLDTGGNRNYFAIDGQSIYLPYESGKLVNYDVTTGKIIWQEQIYGAEDQPMAMSSDPNDQAEMIKALMPLYMTTPLIDNGHVIIASTGQPTQATGWLYSFNKTNGSKKWNEQLPTTFNFYAPVRYKDNYFINSAVYLNKYSVNEGTWTSYGMFDGMEVAGEGSSSGDPNHFDKPIYNQMQANDKSMFIGDESGKFYCLQFDKNGNLPDGDITDPNNTFIRNPKVFKWVFSDEQFNFQKSHITFLDDNTLYVEIKTGLADQSCIFALNADNGEVRWKKIIKGDVFNWALQGDKIVGSTENLIFWMNADGKNYVEMQTVNKPLSNIELRDKKYLIFATKDGIESLDIDTKKSKVIFAKTFVENTFNNIQIKYLPK